MTYSLSNATTQQLRNNAPPAPGDQKVELQAIGGLRPDSVFQQFGILENPFGVTPNPRYLYQSRTHAEASSSLIVGIECGVGFQALIAPPGMGKTTILFNILEQFERVACTAFLFQLQSDSSDLLRNFISELGGDAPDSDLVRMQDTINQLLIRERQAGRRTILIIDEAQTLEPSVLETIRLLSNFETPSEKLLQIILAGQPQLAHRLASAEAAQLSQRISILTTLVPLDSEDTAKYIEHRLKIAGYRGRPLFTAEALRLIWESSSGIPREINKLCFNALLLARAVKQTQVDLQILQEVLTDLSLDRVRTNGGLSHTGIGSGQISESQVKTNKASTDRVRDAGRPSVLVGAVQSDDAATRVIAPSASTIRGEIDLLASPIVGQCEPLSSETAVEIRASDAMEHDSQPGIGESAAAEKAVLPEAIETLRPELERLIGGAEASPPSVARPSPDIIAEPAEKASAMHDAEAICRCGSRFEEGEKFCGKCGIARFKELRQGAQSTLASMWYLQQAQSAQAGHSRDHTISEKITPPQEQPVPLEQIITRMSPPVTDTIAAKTADASTQRPDRGAQTSENESEIRPERPDVSSVAAPPTPKADLTATSHIEAETALESAPIAGPEKSEPTGAHNAEPDRNETAKSRAAGARVDSELKVDLEVNAESRPGENLAAGVHPESQIDTESDAKTELNLGGPAIVPSQAQTKPRAEPKGSLDLHPSVGNELILKVESESYSISRMESDSKARSGPAQFGTPEEQKPGVDFGSDSSAVNNDGTALSRSLSPTEGAALVRELWDTHKASVYLGASILILLVALLGLGAPTVPKGQPPGPQVTAFLEEFQAALGTAKLPSGPIYHGNPNARVWVDVQSALYYCPGARLYGKTKGGRVTTQQKAQQEQFDPADQKACP